MMNLFDITYSTHMPFPWRRFFALSYVKDIIRGISSIIKTNCDGSEWDILVRCPPTEVRVMMVVPSTTNSDQHDNSSVLVIRESLSPGGGNELVWRPLVVTLVHWVYQQQFQPLVVVVNVHKDILSSKLGASIKNKTLVVIPKWHTPSINRTQINSFFLSLGLPPIDQ
jgi:hypothetical protein